MNITQATAADVPDIADLVNSAYRGATAAAGWTHESTLIAGQRTDPATLAGEMQAGATILLAREPGDVAPFGCVQVTPGGAPGEWLLGMLSVSPRRQASGAGRLLLQAGERHARDNGATRIVLHVIHLRRTLIAWYERRGYMRSGRTSPFPYGDARFGIPQRADLHFALLEKDF